MSEGYITRLKVQGILRADINEFLSASRLTGWEVMEFAQTQMQKADGVILINCIRSLQVGWNRDEYSTEKDDLMRTERTLEEQTWQIHVILKRKKTDTDDSVLAEDIAAMLIAWFNGKGCAFLRKRGLANLRIEHQNIIVYNDDSDLYQKRAVFSVKIQVPQSFTFSEDHIDATLPKIKPY